MKIKYSKYTSEDFGIGAEDLLQALSDFLLQSGFNTQYMPFSEWNEHTLEDLKKAIQQALEQGDLFDNEHMREMMELILTGFAHRHALAADRPIAVGPARRQQLRIQRSQVFGFRYRHQTVAPIPAQLSFDATFFVALGRVAVLAPISPMRTERDDPVGFDALPAA